MGHTSLLDLPPELIVRIASPLNTVDLGRFRLLCKHIESHLFDSFAREFFTKRQFMLEENSLQALIDISRHPTLAPYLTYVIIAAQKLNGDSVKEVRQIRGFSSPEQLIASGEACHMLIEAFTNLPNIKTVGVRDYAGPDRTREGQGAEAKWRSYGWTAPHFIVTASTDGPRNPLLSFSESYSTILSLVLTAMGRSRTHPDGFEVILRDKDLYYQGLSYDFVYGRLWEIVRPVFNQLKCLFLPLSFDDTTNTRDNTREGDLSSLHLKRILEAAPNLQQLRLNFASSRSAIQHVSFLHWLAKPPSMIVKAIGDPGYGLCQDVAPVRLASLVELNLGHVSINTDLLLAVLGKFKVRRLALWHLTLLIQRSSVYAMDRLMIGWDETLHLMASELPLVDEIKLGFLSDYKVIDKQRERIVFPTVEQVKKAEKRAGPAVLEFNAKHGSTSAVWLHEVAERAKYLSSRNGDNVSDLARDSASDSSSVASLDGRISDDGEDDDADDDRDEDDDDHTGDNTDDDHLDDV